MSRGWKSRAGSVWCGKGKVCNTTVDVNATFGVDNYRFHVTSIVGAAAATTTTSTIATATCPSTSSTTCVPGMVNHSPNVAAVGDGVGVPLLAIALGLGSWALVERRKRIKAVPERDHNLAMPPGIISGGPTEKLELVSTSFSEQCRVLFILMSDLALCLSCLRETDAKLFSHI
jgi:hypothetical protein